MGSSRDKAALAVLLGVEVLILYFVTLHSSFFNSIPIPVTAIDRAIPFAPIFVVPYFSFYLLVLTPLFVTNDSQEFRDIAFGFGLIVFTSCVAFFFWPTAISTSYTHPLLRGLLAIDLPRNACPSLHASLSLYCALCARRRIHAAFSRYALWTWTLVVIASALLTKRHAAVDIAAGAGLAWIVYSLIFRPIHVEAADSEDVLETLRIRNRPMEKTPGEIGAPGRLDAGGCFQDFAIFVTLAAIGFSISIWALALPSVTTCAAGILITAVALNAFPLLLQEGMHGLLLSSRRWNWIISAMLGATLLMSFSSYRVLHIRHLRHLGGPRNPDDYHNHSHSRSMVWFLHFIWLTCASLLYMILIPVLALKYGSATQRKLICTEYAFLFLIYSILLRAFSVRDLLLVWILPLLLAGTFTVIRGITQRGIAEASDPYRLGRTMLPKPAIAFLLLNENHHLEHHLFPEIASYHLPRLHKSINPGDRH
ncbi:MAG: fatty acid desaturase [Terracidiphilus sp.]|jgi:fatty acid desaturase/membrane-associated phospholipid phosphatase